MLRSSRQLFYVAMRHNWLPALIGVQLPPSYHRAIIVRGPTFRTIDYLPFVVCSYRGDVSLCVMNKLLKNPLCRENTVTFNTELLEHSHRAPFQKSYSVVGISKYVK